MRRTTRFLFTLDRIDLRAVPALALLLAASGCFGGSGVARSTSNSSGNEGTLGVSYEVRAARPVGGTIRSSDGRIDCGTVGTACGPVSYPWAEEVTLTATPDADRRFLSWADDCYGAGTCTLGTALSGANKSVAAVFPLLVIHPGVYFIVTVVKPVGGTISSGDETIRCGTDGDHCGPAHYPWGDQVTLTAIPDAGNSLSGWAGDCSGTGACTLSSNPATDKSIGATFRDASGAPVPAPPAPGAPVPGGTCTPLTCRAGIDCGSISDGCGGIITCGSTCVGGQTCGGSGTPNLCGGGTSSGLFLNGLFLIGVDGPISADFNLWAGRGMNTIVRGPPGPQGISLQTYDGQIDAWNAANGSRAFRRIREPMPGWGAGSDPNGYDSGNVSASNPIGDASISYDRLLAWSQPDEPDINGALSSNLTWLQQYATKWRTADPNRPIYLNFGGNDFLVTGQNYGAAIAYADWISTDVYPYTGLWWDGNQGDPTVVGQILDAISAITTKPKFSWIECGNVSSSRYGAGPTGAQIRTMIWNAVIHGARGYICWISDVDNNFNNSVTSAEGAEIAAINGWIGLLSSVLQDEIIPPVVSGPTASDSRGRGIIHVGGRITPAGRYYVVQNVSNTANFTGSIALPGAGAATGATIYGQGPSWPATADVSSTTCSNCVSGGSITDTLGPNAVHVIQVR
jgi:hypothetical protein